MKKTNYVANDVAMRWLNRSVVAINAILQFIYIYIYIDYAHLYSKFYILLKAEAQHLLLLRSS